MKQSVPILRSPLAAQREQRLIATRAVMGWRHIGTFEIGRWLIVRFEWQQPAHEAWEPSWVRPQMKVN